MQEKAYNDMISWLLWWRKLIDEAFAMQLSKIPKLLYFRVYVLCFIFVFTYCVCKS